MLLLNYLKQVIGYYCYLQVKKQEVTRSFRSFVSLEYLKCHNEELWTENDENKKISNVKKLGRTKVAGSKLDITSCFELLSTKQ